MQELARVCLHCQGPLGDLQTSYCCQGCHVVSELLRGLSQSEKPQFFPAPSLPEKYSYFSEISNRSKFQDADGYIRIFVHGISCTSCALLLEKLPELEAGILSANISVTDHTLTVKLSEKTPLSVVLQWIYKLGFRASVMEVGEGSSRLSKLENRDEIFRLGVAAFFALNQMTFSVAVYAGLTGAYSRAFLYIQGLLFLPVFFYCAWPIYRGALRSLRHRMLSVDLPIAVAFLATGSLSYWDLFLGRDQVYFDSSSGFLFFILAARFVNRSLIQKSSYRFESLESIRTQLVKTSTEMWKRSSELLAGETFFLKAGDWVPTDSQVISEGANFNCSILNGESKAQFFAAGKEVLSGAKLASPSAQLVAKKSCSESFLSRVVNEASEIKNGKLPLTDQMSRLSQWLIFIVMSVALIYFMVHFSDNPTEAFQRALALMVVACPCALALAGPMALNRGLQLAHQLGFLVRNPDILLRLAEVKNILFDKTGTLTRSAWQLEGGRDLSANDKQIILSLEKESQHPIADCVKAAWGELPYLPVQELVEHSGRGVAGKIGRHFYEFQTADASESAEGPSLKLMKDGATVATVQFKDDIGPESRRLMARIRNGYNLFILSGDNRPSTERTAKILSVPIKNVRSSLGPAGKKEFVEGLKNTMMIGDGINDSLALSAADVSVAVSGSLAQAVKSADVYLSNDRLTNIYKILEIGKETKKILHRNLTFALMYNLIAGGFALMGFIGPLAAAVLMPLSSILLALSSFVGTSKLRKLRRVQV